MAIDTRDKRASTELHGWAVLSMVPDGSVNAADRLHLNWLYRGIAASAPGWSDEDIDRDADDLNLVRLAWGSPL